MLGITTKIALDNGALGWGLLAGGLCILPVIIFIIWIAIGIWLYKDAEKRGENGALWLIIGLVTGIIGIIIWFFVRPSMAEVRREREQQEQYGQNPPPPR